MFVWERVTIIHILIYTIYTSTFKTLSNIVNDNLTINVKILKNAKK